MTDGVSAWLLFWAVGCGFTRGFMLTFFYTLRLQASIDSIVFVYSGENDVQLAGVPRSRGGLSPHLLVADTGVNCQFI